MFYGLFSVALLAILLCSVAFNYLVGLRLIGMRKPSRSASLMLVGGIAANLLALGYFKYTNFFIDDVFIGDNVFTPATPSMCERIVEDLSCNAGAVGFDEGVANTWTVVDNVGSGFSEGSCSTLQGRSGREHVVY